MIHKCVGGKGGGGGGGVGEKKEGAWVGREILTVFH